MLKIANSPDHPPDDALVATRHRRHGYYISADDIPSKMTFRLVQNLINMHLVEPTPQAAPTLTIPEK